VVRTQSINPGRLLKDTFRTIGSIYIPLLVFGLSELAVLAAICLGTLIGALIGAPLITVLTILLRLIFSRWVCSAVIYYTYQYLSGNRISIGSAFRRAISQTRRLILLILGYFLLLLISISAPYLLIILIIPGIYLSVRLGFVLHGITVDNLSFTRGIRHSWNLVKGHWWSTFIAMIVVLIVSLIFLTLIVVGILIGAALIPDSANSQVISIFTFTGVSVVFVSIYLVIAPFMTVYYTLLYKFLRANKNKSNQLPS
jgi:membrane-anchored glycerophosphoryl diester phosphodiesterase (GDPDase)